MDRFPGSNDFGPEDHFDGEVSLPLNDHSVLPNFEQKMENQQEGDQSVPPPPQSRSGTISVAAAGEGGEADAGARGCSSAASDCGFGSRRVRTMKEYQNELEKLRKENLDLKLRIYLLEEKHGLLPSAKKDSKENVYRINLDLRVQNETLQKDMDDQKRLLRNAYNAIESLEAERLRERHEYESQIESMRQSLLDSQFAFNSGKDGSKSDRDNNFLSLDNHEENVDKIEIGDKSRALLEDAFGNLEELPQNKEMDSQLEQQLEDLQQKIKDRDDQVVELEAHVKSLENEINVREEKIKSIKNDLEEKEEDIAKETAAFDKMTMEFHAKINELQDMVDKKGHRVSVMEEELKEFRAKEEQEKAFLIAELCQRYERKEEDMKKRIQQLETENKKLEDNFNKSQLCVKGLLDGEVPIINENETLSKELKIKNAALEKLTEEYERVKQKVRKYRAQKNTMNSSDMTANTSGDPDTLGKLISEVDEVKSREAILKQEVERLQDILKEYEYKIEELRNQQAPSTISRENDVDVQRMANLEEENSKLKRDLDVARTQAFGSGAAMRKPTFSKPFDPQTKALLHTISALRKNLIGLVKFFERLFNEESGESFLDLSWMNDSIRASLCNSINDARRLSQSISVSFVDDKEDDVKDVGGLINIIEIELEEKVKILESALSESEKANEDMNLKMEEMKQVQTDLAAEVKDNVKTRIEAQKVSERLRKDLEALTIEVKEKNNLKIKAEGQIDKLKKEQERLLSEIRNNARLRYDSELETKKLKAELDKLKELKEKKESCDHEERIRTLEQLLAEKSRLYEEAEQRWKKAEELKKRREKAIKDQMENTKKVLQENRLPSSTKN